MERVVSGLLGYRGESFPLPLRSAEESSDLALSIRHQKIAHASSGSFSQPLSRSDHPWNSARRLLGPARHWQLGELTFSAPCRLADLLFLSQELVLLTPQSATASASNNSAEQPCSPRCTPAESALYSPEASSSSEIASRQPVQITYGTGRARGILVEDRMGFAGFSALQVRCSPFDCSCYSSLTFQRRTDLHCRYLSYRAHRYTLASRSFGARLARVVGLRVDSVRSRAV